MFVQADSVAQGSRIETDICVVGAGAAGIAFAREFMDTGIRICILESGNLATGKDRTAIRLYRLISSLLMRILTPGLVNLVTKKIRQQFAHDPLYDVECTGLPISHTSRRRAFGGSTIAWHGKWKRHDGIDFEKRPWVPNSGWPLNRDELDPYYVRASASLLAPDATDDAADENLLQGSAFEAVPFLMQKKDLWNWGVNFKQDFERSSNLRVYLGAHVFSLVKNGSRLESVQVKTREESMFEVRSRYFVLACGGIENARLLLVSQIGNEHDQVGRYYMDHPKGNVGTIKTKRLFHPSRDWEVNGRRHMFIGFRLSNAAQEREQILNSHVFLEPDYGQTLGKRILRIFLGRFATRTLVVANCMEQVPVATNRVQLSETKDPLGLPKAMLSWSLSDLDKKTMVIFHRYLKEALAQLGVGELKSPLLGGSLSDFPITEDAFHHMGTTRMGRDPLNSVVDENCRIHSIDNLFVAGSSVFPTGGHANPTATLCALSIRLADHMKKLLK